MHSFSLLLCYIVFQAVKRRRTPVLMTLTLVRILSHRWGLYLIRYVTFILLPLCSAYFSLVCCPSFLFFLPLPSLRTVLKLMSAYQYLYMYVCHKCSLCMCRRYVDFSRYLSLCLSLYIQIRGFLSLSISLCVCVSVHTDTWVSVHVSSHAPC